MEESESIIIDEPRFKALAKIGVKVKNIVFTNAIEFRKTEYHKSRKSYLIENYIDPHHHKIYVKINGKTVYSGIVDELER